MFAPVNPAGRPAARRFLVQLTAGGGVNLPAPNALRDMTDHADPTIPEDALDELVFELLGVGAVLSQIVSHMIRSEAEGRTAPDAAPIPEVAHTVLRDVLSELRKRHSSRDLRIASAIVGEATEAICDGLFLVNPDLN